MRRFSTFIGTALLLTACAATPPADSNQQPPPADQASSSSTTDSMSQSSAPSGTTARVIEVKAANFSFTPSTIRLKKGEKVTIRLTSESGIHGFLVVGMGINEKVEPGQTVDVVIPTDNTGEFEFICSIPCGPGHSGMVGKIVIE